MAEKSYDTWTSDALQNGDFDAIRNRVLVDPTYVSSPDSMGDTPLRAAIALGAADLVQFLLEQGASPNVEVDDGYTCILTAVESDEPASVEIVSALIAAGADIHGTRTLGCTPLHMAAACGQAAKARLLLEAGADVNQRKEIDATETPLMEAAFTGRPETVRILLDNGADPTMRDSMQNRTPLQIAQATAAGPDPAVYKGLKTEDFQIDVDEMMEMYADMDLLPEQLDLIKSTVENLDMAENYLEGSKTLVEKGNHAEVIRILTEHATQHGYSTRPVVQNARSRFAALALLVSIAAVAIAATGVVWFVDWLDPFNDRRFTPAAWTQAEWGEPRAVMSRDLVDHHLPPGTPKAQVEALLGQPDSTIHDGKDGGGNRFPGQETYAYGIGSYSLHGYDDAFVYVHFDSSGHVVGAEINGY